jgi:hypothetical protein
VLKGTPFLLALRTPKVPAKGKRRRVDRGNLQEKTRKSSHLGPCFFLPEVHKQRSTVYLFAMKRTDKQWSEQ